MNSSERQALANAMSYRNYSIPDSEKPRSDKQEQIKLDPNGYKQNKGIKDIKKENPRMQQVISLVSVERLQDAIIWSEILGKPVSKRRKRR